MKDLGINYLAPQGPPAGIRRNSAGFAGRSAAFSGNSRGIRGVMYIIPKDFDWTKSGRGGGDGCCADRVGVGAERRHMIRQHCSRNVYIWYITIDLDIKRAI